MTRVSVLFINCFNWQLITDIFNISAGDVNRVVFLFLPTSQLFHVPLTNCTIFVSYLVHSTQTFFKVVPIGRVYIQQHNRVQNTGKRKKFPLFSSSFRSRNNTHDTSAAGPRNKCGAFQSSTEMAATRGASSGTTRTNAFLSIEILKYSMRNISHIYLNLLKPLKINIFLFFIAFFVLSY